MGNYKFPFLDSYMAAPRPANAQMLLVSLGSKPQTRALSGLERGILTSKGIENIILIPKT